MTLGELPLPSGWTYVPLDHLGRWIGGGTPAKSEVAFWRGGSIPWVSPKDMKVADVHSSEDHITEAAVSKSATNLIPAGAVLVVTRSGILSHALPVAVTHIPVTVNQDLKALVPISAALPQYVAAALRANARDILARCSKDGTTVRSIEMARFVAYELPLAPLGEQGRIVETIESYVSRLDEAEVALERVQRNLKRYRSAVLQAAVEGRLVPTEARLARAEGRDYEPAPELLKRILAERRRRWEEAELARLTAAGEPPKDDRWKARYEDPEAPPIGDLPGLPEGWCWATVGQVGEASGGLTKNPKRDGLPVKLPYLRVANVYANELRLSDVESIGAAEAEVERTLLDRGDLLVVEGNGSVEQIGRVALWDGSIDPCVHQNHIIKVRFPTVSTSGWVLWSLLSPSGRTHIRRVASSTSGLHTLSLSKVARLPLPLPPASEQLRIHTEIDRRFSLAAVGGERSVQARVRSHRLRQSILKWAFEGRLVDQDPNDEPASVLLERIRQERAAPGDTAVKPGKARARKAR